MAGEHVVGPRVLRANEATARVTPLELFFDLVFVYALTQVTAMLAHDISAIGFARGLVVLSLVWWCWVGYSWLGNVAQADEGVLRLMFFLVMMAMFVMAITIPETFDDLPGGLDGPLVFVACYLVVHLAHLSLFWIAATGDAGLRHQTHALRADGVRGRPAARRRRPARLALAALALGRGPARRPRRHDGRRCVRVGGSRRPGTSPSGTG